MALADFVLFGIITQTIVILTAFLLLLVVRMFQSEQLVHDLFQSFWVDSFVVSVEDPVNLVDFFIKLRFTHNVAHDQLELFKVDFFLLPGLIVRNEYVLHVLVARFLPKAPQQVFQFSG